MLPHLLLVVVDDLGWNDVGFQRNATPGQHNVMRTPQLDRLAREGVRLADFAVYKYCSPSRSQMLVGRYAYHVGQQSSNLGAGPGSGCALSTEYAMLPAVLKRRGYATHLLGKYHRERAPAPHQAARRH